jgi:serine/threonine protein kinase/HAMP domain-containing protein
MDILGKSIGRYEIIEHIGAGAMAEVYKAYDPEIDRTVALKILKEEHCVDEEHIGRFLKEGKAAGALTHPNIVTVHDVGQLENAPYIMMELLDGKPLSEVLAEGGRLPSKTILRIGLQMANALDYAHSKGVVHRDVKPDNIMLGSDGLSIKIADFGIARVETGASKDATQVGMILGTPRYMSPEQASGEVIDGRSDLFSLGVILYEMITGQKAFDADSMATLIMQIVQKDPLPIRQLNSSAPAGLQNIVNKLLQKKPSRRFANGRELSEALERELRVLEEDEEEKSNYIPLQLKWTGIMGAVVALSMAVSSVLVIRAQSVSLEQQAIDSGISLAKFISVQAAIPVLGEDWITLESFVEDASARETFDYLIVSDHNDTVRSASDPALVGTPLQKTEEAETLYAQDDIVVTRVGEGTESSVFNFHLPILFRSTVVGSVDVGLATDSLDTALDTTRRLMFALAVAMVGAVLVVIYVFNKLIAKNLLLATRALKIFTQGQLESRITKQREDEFGDLFGAFNAMADEMQRRIDAAGDAGDPAPVPPVLSESALDISGIAHGIVEEQTIVRTLKKDDDASA